MSAVLDQVLSANTQYAADFGDKGSLALPPPVVSPCSPVWTRASIPPRPSACRREMRT